MESSIRILTVLLGGTALLAITAVSTATAGGVGDGPLTVPQQGIFTMQEGPIINRIGTYTPPHVNRACPTPRPELSEEQQHRNEKGDVVIGVYVSPYGHVRKITVAKSSGFEDLDNAAAASAASWHYIPATMEAAAVSGWTAVKFHFAPQDPSEQSREPAATKDCI